MLKSVANATRVIKWKTKIKIISKILTSLIWFDGETKKFIVGYVYILSMKRFEKNLRKK